MRHLSWIVVVVAVFALPLTAKAGFILEGSAGTGWQVKPSVSSSRQPTNILIAPGYGLGKIIRAELGFEFELGDVEHSNFAFGLRPMLVIDPPIIPLYARLIVAAHDVFKSGRAFAFGGAVGLGGSIMGLGLFVEGGVVPRFVSSETQVIVEARAGAYYAF